MTGVAPVRVGCCAELAEPGWRWVANALDPTASDWTFFSTTPRSPLERAIRRPRLARYRACHELARATMAGHFDLIVTHHPLVTCWTELFCGPKRRRCPHVAFSFNFTRLPRGMRNVVMRRAFASVDRFVVFSTFERELYSRHFKIPSSKIEMIHWGVRDPAAQDGARDPGPAALSNSICAVGSQARDYATLFAAMRLLPAIRLEVVATPQNLRGLSIPPNVDVKLNVTRDEAERVIRRSRFMVLPLLDSETPCGHVTMVTAMFLSRAILATDSAGLSDYVFPGETGLLVPPGDPAAMAAAIERLWNDGATRTRLGENARAFALAHCTEAHTVAYVRSLIDGIAGGGDPVRRVDTNLPGRRL